MGCSSCQNKPAPFVPTLRVFNEPVDCDYTTDQIIEWKNKLLCVGDNYVNFNLTKKEYNKHLGVVFSITNFNNNPCYFKDSLDALYPIIMLIINSHTC